jgi:hypothetical protein
LWYTFRVTAINSIGEGPQTDSIPILAAQVPTAPLTPELHLQTPSQIVLKWQAPYNGGSVIRDYNVLIDSVGIGEYT